MLSDTERSNLAWKENMFMVGFGYALAAPLYMMWSYRSSQTKNIT